MGILEPPFFRNGVNHFFPSLKKREKEFPFLFTANPIGVTPPPLPPLGRGGGRREGVTTNL